MAEEARCFHRQGNPIIGVDAKKRELVGNFRNADNKWDRVPTPVNDHDFRSLPPPFKAGGVGKDAGVNRARLFSRIARNWAGEPVSSYEKILKFIRTTKTSTGLKVRACPDRRDYPPRFAPNWNYTIKPSNVK